MRYLKFLFITLCLGFFLTTCTEDEIIQDHEGYLQIQHFYTGNLAGNAFEDDAFRFIDVYLPKNYLSQAKSYPVLYLLHGIPLGYNSYTSKTGWDNIENNFIPTYFNETANFPTEGFEAWMNKLMAGNDVDEMIIVMADATTKYGLSMYTNSPLHGNYENFIAEELVKIIDSKFRTIANSENRYIAGHCMGGYGALRIAMKHPGVFGKVAALTPFNGTSQGLQASLPAIYLENPVEMGGPSLTKFMTFSVYGMAAAWSPNLNNPPYFVDLPFDYETGTLIPSVVQKWENENLFHLLNNHGQALASMKGIYIDAGDKDELGLNLSTLFLHAALDGAGIQHQFEIFEGGHFNMLYNRLEEAMIFLSLDI